MARDLSDLRAELLSSIRSSMQSSYARRAPEESSMPCLVRARAGLREFLLDHPQSAEGWEMLSRAEECLLNYPEAIRSLREAMALSGKRDRRSLKRLALMQEAVSEWSELPLTPSQLRALGEYLVQHGASEERHGRTLEFTTRWLKDNELDSGNVLESLGKRGGFTDFQVLHNVVHQ
jgi:hypothetical protein